MKFFVLIISFIGASLFSSAQKIAVSADKYNIMLQELENPITIAAENTSCKDLYVTIDNGTITGSNGLYVCKPNKVGRANIVVSVKKNGKLKTTRVFAFRVINLMNDFNTVFKVGPCGHGCSISKRVLAAQEYVRVELEGTDFDVKLTVDSFTVHIISSVSGTTNKIKNIGNQITTSVKEAFASLKDGDMVLFKEIFAVGPDGRSIETKPVVMFVRE